MPVTQEAPQTLVSLDGSVPVPLADVFVSIDLGRDVTYVAYDDGYGIHWDELSLADGELLARMGLCSLLWIGLPLVVGLIQVLRKEVK